MWQIIEIIKAACKKAEHAFLWIMLRHQRQNSHVEGRFLLLAWIGFFGMPLYYLIWTISFPQEFESLSLRALGFAVCLPAIFWRKHLQGVCLSVYQFGAITYMLPFFFTFMFLMNLGSAVWSQSLLVALIVLFHFNALWAAASFTCGTLAAGAAFGFVGDAAFLTSPEVIEQVPIYIFTILVVSLTKVSRRVLANEKLAGMAQGLASVSHELRTPLISVAANARGIERCMGSAEPATESEREAIAEAMARIQFEVRHMNHMIDLFLLSSAAMNQQLEATEHISMRDVVDSVLGRYPFSGQAQRESVSIKIRGDFMFAGKFDLGVVILLNLIRNALKAVQRAGKGRIRIIVDGTRATPRLMVIDTGCGISSVQQPLIFQRFFSYPPSSGSGIGLALCKDIVDAWHARIRCISRELAYTVFVLEFPRVPPSSPTALHTD
jgi:two-component system CAI-1 autoinducer sensor kinase/phosphatase CqsS